jgi:hypothetical protein
MSKKLMDEIQAYEDYQSAQLEDIERLKKRLADLEKTRQESFDLVAGDNSNGHARQNLDATDRKIAELKKEIGSHNRRTRSRLRSLRARLLQTQEKSLGSLNLKIQECHREQTEIREKSIPEAEQHLTALQERARKAEEEIKQARKEIADINRLNLDVLFQE